MLTNNIVLNLSINIKEDLSCNITLKVRGNEQHIVIILLRNVWNIALQYM